MLSSLPERLWRAPTAEAILSVQCHRLAVHDNNRDAYDATIPQLRAFLQDGGTIITIGSSAANLEKHLDLPLEDHLVDAAGRPLPDEQYYIPGSLRRRHEWTTPGGLAAIEAKVGDGKLFMFGPGIVERAQPHGTFKFLINAI